MWQYAINAVLHDLRGERQGVVPWRDGAARVALRKQYIALYRCLLERKFLESSGTSTAVSGPS